MNLRYTLLADGGSDRSLLPILDWSLRSLRSDVITSLESQWADLSFLRTRPRNLAERMRTAVNQYPCDLLFVHRDAEGEAAENRLEEIKAAAQTLRGEEVSCVPVVPVRMTEAWLLVSERAIRSASGNPSGMVKLRLPTLRTLESQSDPKELLFEKLRLASGLTGRRLARFEVEAARTRVSQFIDDFASLRELESFRHFEGGLESVLQQISERQMPA